MDLDMISVGSGLPDPKTAEALAEKAEALVTSFRATIGNLSEAVSAARQRIESQHSSIVPTNVPKSQVQGIVGAVKVAVDRDARAFTADLLKSSDHDRTEQLRQAKSHADSLASLLHVYPTPTSYLSGTTVSDPRRAQYVAALAHAGPAELSTYARQALATNDRALAAAIVSRNDALGEKGRLFSSLDFAKKFVGAEHAALDRAAKRAGAALQAMLLANRQLSAAAATARPAASPSGCGSRQRAASRPTRTRLAGPCPAGSEPDP